MPHLSDTNRPDRRLDDVAAEFVELRPRLLAIAHRVLGSRSEAEDVVQEAWLRWQTCDRARVRNVTAFLVTTTTRLAINVTQSACARRECAVGEWPQDPVEPGEDPAAGVERREALAVGLVVLLERLSPAERAAYVLREAFDYPYGRIAGMLDVTEVHARQHVSRAGKHLTTGRRQTVDRVEHRRLVEAFDVAARRGEVAVLEDVFVTDRTPALSLAAR